MKHPLFVLLALTACSDPEKQETDAVETEQPAPEAAQEPETNEPSAPPIEAEVLALNGSIIWNIDFDTDAEALGFTDCSYQRDYTGIEDRSAKWLCPTCEQMFLLDVDLSQGLEDCYQQIATSPAPQERLGWTADGEWRRAPAPSYALTEQGAVTWDGASFTTANTTEVELDDGGTFTFDIDGTFALSEGIGDPMHGMTPPSSYSCGWQKADPPAYDGDYTLAIGQTLPDGVFLDQCNESVRLHDFKGTYIVIDISAVNCPPCRSMAETEPAFADDMEQQGIPVSVVTLMAPSLSEVLSPTPQETLLEWVESYDLHSPVLSDRGWGYWLGGTALGDEFAYPTWIVIDPELNVLAMGTGFSSWDEIATTITNHFEQ